MISRSIDPMISAVNEKLTLWVARWGCSPAADASLHLCSADFWRWQVGSVVSRTHSVVKNKDQCAEIKLLKHWTKKFSPHTDVDDSRHAGEQHQSRLVIMSLFFLSKSQSEVLVLWNIYHPIHVVIINFDLYPFDSYKVKLWSVIYDTQWVCDRTLFKTLFETEIKQAHHTISRHRQRLCSPAHTYMRHTWETQNGCSSSSTSNVTCVRRVCYKILGRGNMHSLYSSVGKVHLTVWVTDCI